MVRKPSVARASRSLAGRLVARWLLLLPALALLPGVAHGTTYRIATGRYTGNGAPLRSIAGLGFQPDLVLVKGDRASATLVRMSGMPANAAKSLGAAGTVLPNGIVALDGNGFSVGNDPAVNAAVTDYYWVAFAASPDLLVLGSFAGDGLDNRHVSVGFQPSYVLLFGDGGQLAMQRFAAQPADLSVPFVDGGERGNCIQSFDSTGFTVGFDPLVNAGGTVYFYAAWKAAFDILADGSYTGDGSGNHDIVTGFQPEYAIVARKGAGSPAVQRSDSLDVDMSLFCDATGGMISNAIRTFQPTGFNLGSDPNANSSGANYYYAAFNTAADLTVTKTVGAPAAAPGDTVTYLVTVTNHGPGDMNTIRVDDFLPSGLTHVANTPSQGSYTPLNGRWVVGTLAGGVAATLGIQARVNAGSSGSIVNTASSAVFDGSGDANLNNNGGSAAITVQTGDLAVSKIVDRPIPIEGQTVTYTVTVTNLGVLTTTGIVVTDVLPAGTTYESHTASHGDYTGGTGSWAVGTLDPLESAALQLTARVGFGTAGTPIANTASLSAANQVDLNRANDSGTAAITPIAASNTDLALAKSVDDPHPVEGGSLTYTVTVSNNGPNPGTGIQVLDLLPLAVDYASHVASQGTYDAGTGVWSVGSLGVGGSATLSLAATLDVGARVAVVSNQASLLRADQFDPVPANDTARVDIPTVQVEPLPIGTSTVHPGTPDVPLLVLRLENHRPQTAVLSGLHLAVGTGLTRLRLWRDDGDLVLDPQADTLLATGTPAAASWTAGGFAVALPTAESATLFVSGDISLSGARHGLVLSASVPALGDLTWNGPLTVATPQGFPLSSPGSLTVADLVRAQIAFVPLPADTVFVGAAGVPLLRFRVPDDGGAPDVLERIDMLQVGDAVSGVDLARLHLQTLAVRQVPAAGPPGEDAAPPGQIDASAAPGGTPRLPEIWVDFDVAEFFHTGGERWSASGFQLPIPAGGLDVRVVADVAEAAREGRQLRGALPLTGLAFASGRRGPEDQSWSNPGGVLVRAERVLQVSQVSIPSPAVPVPRGATRLGVLGLALQARSATPDTLVLLRLLHTSTGPEGPAVDPSAQIAAAELWLDSDASGTLGGGDSWLASTVPDGSGQILFGNPLGVGLESGVPVQLLVTLTPDSLGVRDGESLRVRLAAATDIVTAHGLAVQLPAALETLAPPVVDGQSARGYAVRSIGGGALFAGSTGTVVLDLALPANGVEDDGLQAFRLENSGTATASDIEALQLYADDGDGRITAADVLVASLKPKGGSGWEASGIGWPLLSASPQRFLVVLEVSKSPQSGATFRARVPLLGITVTSGNDGPIDAALLGGNPFVFSVPDRITWIAGIADDHVVHPDAQQQAVMVLELFNGYASSRTLSSLEVVHQGNAAAVELRAWDLVADDNANGVLDASDRELSAGTLDNGRIHFGGFAYTLAPQKQQRLLVAYSLLPSAARDGSTLDLTLESAAAIGYAEPGTASDGAFPLDSPGTDVVDGFVSEQVENGAVASRTLGASETDVLVFSLLLPSNGWQPDTLQALRLEPVATDSAAVLGEDVASYWLWQESGASLGFDPGTDLRLQSAVAQGAQLLFETLQVLIPAGGRRFYITLDTSPAPTEGRRVALRVPVLGVEMASGDDGPLDTAIDALAVHRFSADDLLASVSVAPILASRGQTLDLTVLARNQGTTSFPRVVPRLLSIEPSGGAVLVSGPEPPALALAPRAEGSFSYRFTATATGPLRFTVQVADSTVQSDPATSTPVVVVEPPSALEANLVSRLPPTVNRGQTVTVMEWELSHPDPPSGTADIRIESLQFVVEDGSGNGQPADAVFEHLEVRAGGLVHAQLDSMPAASSVQLPLSPPVVLHGSDAVGLTLSARVATQAAASSVRLRVTSAAAIAAEDANSSQPVTVRAALPWTSQSATIHTQAARIAIELERTLPLAVNRGQRDVPAGRFRFALEGALDESEARITALSIAWRDSSGDPLSPAGVVRRLAVRNGTTTLLEMTDPGDEPTLQLPLAIPQLVASGAPQALDLFLNVRDEASVPAFAIVVLDSSAFTVRDATSGAPVAIAPGPTALPWILGPVLVQTPASDVALHATSRTPPSSFPGARNLPVARLSLDRLQVPSGTADVQIGSLTFRTLDDRGLDLTDVLSSARLLAGGATVAATGALSGSPWLTLTLATPLRIAAGEGLDLDLEVDLAATVAAEWLRFSFEPQALQLRDANDPSRLLATTGALPFATELVRIVAPPVGVAAGPTAEPPANVRRGAAEHVLALQLRHPGGANEAAIQPLSLVLLLRDPEGAPLAVNSLAGAARLRFGAQNLAAVLGEDSLVVDLASLPPLAPGEAHDLDLELDILGSPQIADFRLALQADGVEATSGGERVQTRPLDGATLPWLSPTVHLAPTGLRESLSSYPNPFTPALHGNCHITFVLAAEAQVSAEIYTLTGEPVVSLLHGAPLGAGLHDDLRWDGRNGAGDLVRNGTYLLRLVVDGAGGGTFLRKLAVKR